MIYSLRPWPFNSATSLSRDSVYLLDISSCYYASRSLHSRLYFSFNADREALTSSSFAARSTIIASFCCSSLVLLASRSAHLLTDCSSAASSAFVFSAIPSASLRSRVFVTFICYFSSSSSPCSKPILTSLTHRS